MAKRAATNAQIAGLLDRIGDLLEAKEESPFRIRSYRNAAAAIRGSRRTLASLVRSEGSEGLTGIRGIGEKLSGLIREFVETGKCELLQTLEKEVPAEKLESLKKKRAPEKPGAGKSTPAARTVELPVAVILGVDEEYRRRAAENTLKRIAPRLMNPGRKAWLPLMITEKKGFKFTVMFSNTPRAHELGKTNDWVVVYYEKGKRENQCTVVTESRGPLKDKRVIRGRERECAEHYR